jgi:hypothetical protein
VKENGQKRVVGKDWAEFERDSRKKGRLGPFVAHYINFKAHNRIFEMSQQRIRELLDSTIYVVPRLQMMPHSVRDGWSPDEMNSVRKALKDLNRQFAKYPSVDQLSENGTFYIKAMSKKIPPLEISVVHAIRELVAQGLIQRFRQCPSCEELFYATRANQTSCSPTCRHDKYEQTEEFKQKNRERAHRNYWLHKEMSKGAMF